MKGRPTVILGSGPSLTDEDIATVERSGLYTIAVNSTWKSARFCNAIYAGDERWWRAYADEIDIDATRVSLSRRAAVNFGAKHHRFKVEKGYNSGMLAIDYALRGGASLVILLGFDCSVRNGLHHFGGHTKTHNPTSKRCDVWQGQFKRLAKRWPHADVVNCSRYTELRTYRRAPLESILCELT
jgi:hypothetical protein